MATPRVSTDTQDLTSQPEGLTVVGVVPERIYIDHGLTGTNRERPGLREAMAACRAGDILVVTKLDRFARSLPDAREILSELTRRGVKLSLGGVVHDPTDPVGSLLFNVLAMVAKSEADLIRLRTREGMKVAKANGRLRGKQPKLPAPGGPRGGPASGRRLHEHGDSRTSSGLPAPPSTGRSIGRRGLASRTAPRRAGCLRGCEAPGDEDEDARASRPA